MTKPRRERESATGKRDRPTERQTGTETRAEPRPETEPQRAPQTETELKLAVPPEAAEALLAALAPTGWQTLALAARYFDTSDGRLAAAGASLRLRQEDGRWVQTLKMPGHGPAQRLEHEADLGTLEPAPAAPRLARHQGSAALEALAAAVAPDSIEALENALVERHATRIERRRQRLALDGAQLEVALDQGSVQAGDRSAAVSELELEFAGGAPAGLFATAQRLVRDRGLWLSSATKAERGLWLAQGRDHGAATKAGAARLDRSMDRPQVLRAVVAGCLAQMLPNAGALAAGSADDEHVHQLRVGIRRLRTALRELGDFAPGVDAAWEPVLVAAFRRLGAHRDQVVVAGAIVPRLAAAGAPRADWPDDGAGAGDPGVVVREPAFQAVLVALQAFAADATLPADPAGATKAAAGAGALVGDSAAGDAAVATASGDAVPDAEPMARRDSPRRALRARLGRLHRRVCRDGARFVELDADGQHRVRKRLKRLRYLAEFAAPLFGAHAAQRYLAHLRPAQDALGALNDDAVALAAYRAAAAQDERAWFAVGWLTARRECLAQDCQAALAKVAAAQRFWKKSAR